IHLLCTSHHATPPRLKVLRRPVESAQYQMPVYGRRLKQQKVRQSMSRKGNCLDNATMESFFGTLKSEFFYMNRFRNVDELQTGIKDYIHYYNHDRIKLRLQGLSPVQYRMKYKQH
ncbi:IS3 family transposase, partial [Caballeronia concitans]